MKYTNLKALLVIAALCTSGAANAGFGVGFKAGTLGLGVEGRWAPIPWFDIRVGINQYEYDDDIRLAGLGYDSTLTMDTYSLTGNFKFPLSPFRVTAGVLLNGNEFQASTQPTNSIFMNVGELPFDPNDVGVLQATVTFDDTSPYLGFGFDFEIFGKVGLNLDLGVLWQGDPIVTLEATGLETLPWAGQDVLEIAIEIERQELENEMSDYKAWPVISLGFVYNF